MRKISYFAIFVAVFVATSVNVFAQSGARTIDNFDMRSGVQIYLPPKPEAKPVASSAKNSKKKAPVKITMIGNRNLSAPAMRMAMGGAKSLGSFSTGDAAVDSYITASCARYNIDPLLIYAQMHQESSFKMRAISYKGARGLMQLMPATAVRFGVTNIFDPKQNIDAGVKYMRWLLDKFGQDLRLALAGYNAGEGAVMKYGNQIPPYRETQDYVARITARYAQISNPNFIRNVAPAAQPRQDVAKLQTPVAAPPVYAPSSMIERLPDGKIRLVTQ